MGAPLSWSPFSFSLSLSVSLSLGCRRVSMHTHHDFKVWAGSRTLGFRAPAAQSAANSARISATVRLVEARRSVADAQRGGGPRSAGVAIIILYDITYYSKL